MKKVGIITMHKPINYGSYLQTYATCFCIKRLGYAPIVVDYRYPTSYHSSLRNQKKTKFSIQKFLRYILSIFCNILTNKKDSVKMKKMEDFYSKHIVLSSVYNSLDELEHNPPNCDIYLTGSDQVWNPLNLGEDTTFLLSWVPKGKRKISYSASFGVKELPDRFKYLYKRELSEYSHISTREHSDILYKLLGKDCPTVLDPTLLLNKESWSELISHKRIIEEDYILCYILSYSFNPYPYVYKIIDFVKEQLGVKVILIDSDTLKILKGYKLLPNCGPEDFLNLFYYAKFIITSSFHGTAFAINFRKSFYSIIDNSETLDNRQISLLESMNLSQCAITKNTPIDNLRIPIIDYDSISKKMEENRRFSLDYLTSALNNEDICTN